MNKECLFMELDFTPSTMIVAPDSMSMVMIVLDHLQLEPVEELFQPWLMLLIPELLLFLLKLLFQVDTNGAHTTI